MEEQIIQIDPELCTGCGHCKEVCPVGAISGTAHSPHVIDKKKCVLCGQCILACYGYDAESERNIEMKQQRLEKRNMFRSVHEPLFAAYYIGTSPQLMEALRDKDTFSVVQCAPAVRVSIAEEFNMPFGSITPGKLAAALRKLGFDRVYDTNFAADLTVIEEGAELVERIQNNASLPMFTSCCPAWVKYVEDAFPDLRSHLSSCKSPQQMGGAVFKTYGAKLNEVDPASVYSVAVMPCTCKKFEASRPEMNGSSYRDVDAVVTTRELARLLKYNNIDFASLEDEEFDKPLGEYSGAGNIFGVTGGVMEAALRTACEKVTGVPLEKLELDFVRGSEGVRKATVTHEGLELTIAVVAGLQNAAPLLEEVRQGTADFQFLEVMCCPEGCISGGGQPKVILPAQRPVAVAKRKAALYSHDQHCSVRKAHENPGIIKLYDEFLGEPLGHTSHHLLHTEHEKNRGSYE